MSNPLVSVIVPVYNVERYLEQCIDALLAQTLSDIEVIAIDDGSTDSSPEILARKASADGRLRVITKSNEGYGVAVNRGIDEARAAYVGIVEPDDYPEPAMFKKLHDAAVRFDADLVKCDFFDTFEDGEQPRRNLSSLPHGVLFDPIDYPEIALITPSIWAALYRRDMLEEHAIRCRTTPGAAFQDTSFCLRCLAAARRCVLLAPALLHYRRDNPNSSVQSSDKIFTVADEFAYARECLSRDPQRYNRLIAHMRLNEWRTHRWDSMRVSADARGDYFERVRDEFMRAEQAHEVDRSLFDQSELERYRALLEAQPSDLGAFDATVDERALRSTAKERARSLTVSIVMPAHNDAVFVERAVRSCLGQSHQAIELICVDDGSSDATLDVLEGLARGDSRMRVISLGRNGLTHNARLAGVRVARGDLVTFLDADDELDARACERIAVEYARWPYDILQFGADVVSDGKAGGDEVRAMRRWCRPPRAELTSMQILVGAFVDFAYSASIWGKAFRADIARAAFESLGEVEADSGEDQMEYFAIACRAGIYRGVRRDLYRYHLGDGESGLGNMTRAGFGRALRGARALEGIRDFLDRSGLLPEFAGIYDVHRLGQLNFLLRTINEDVRLGERRACLEDVEKIWGLTRDEASCGSKEGDQRAR